MNDTKKYIGVIREFYNYFLSADKNFVRELYAIMGFTPRKLPFYKRAFTHKSKSKNAETTAKSYMDFNNERLEFLGDAILDSVTAEYLFKKYPTKNEGFLTQMRSKMVNRKTLNRIADEMGLDLFLKKQGATRISQTMMGNTFEAFIGAIYLDVGYKRTQNFILKRMLRKHIDIHKLETTDLNYKSQLLEYTQKEQKTISYQVIKHYRNKNNRERFKVAVLIDEKQMGIAEDFSKKSAEQRASRLALLKLGLVSKEEVED